MVRAIMHGCNGHMGQVITGLIKDDPEIEIVAGVDPVDCRDNGYPVFPSIDKCTVEADVIIDFTSAKAVDGLIAYSAEKKVPVVLCTTGLSEEQLKRLEEASSQVAVLRSANMSLGINMLMKILQDAAKILVPAGFDIEIVVSLLLQIFFTNIDRFFLRGNCLYNSSYKAFASLPVLTSSI